MIAGIYVGLEGPSWVGAMMAIANATTDKVAYCNDFGIEILGSEWPCRSMPAAILGDRGEMLGAAAETLVKNFGVRLENTPPYRADWKGIVERYFGLLPAVFKPYVPGYVATDYRERGAKDYRLDAELNIEQFTRIVIQCILYYNNEHEISDYPLDSAMRQDDVRPIPVELWEWGVARRSGLQRVYPDDHVRLSLMPTGEATVTESGIRFYGVYYSCSRAVENNWFERARKKKFWKVNVSYDPRNLDQIHLHDPDAQYGFLPCGLTQGSERWRGMPLCEIEQIRKNERAAKARHQPRELAARINLEQSIRDTIQSAKAGKKSSKHDGQSKASRVGKIQKNRAEERRVRQGEETFGLGASAGLPERGEVIPFPNASALPADHGLPSIADILHRMGDKGEKEGNDD